MPRLSAIIIALNEAGNIADCLDTLSFCDERIVVVDYKTDSLISTASFSHERRDADVDAPTDIGANIEANIEDALTRYRAQGATYALAVETVLQRPVDDVVFIFAHPHGAIARSLPDLGAAIQTVREYLQLS